MSGSRRDDGSDAYGVEEIAVELSISDGKFAAETKSGPKSGSLELVVDGTGATLALEGAGSDRASATLTGPELANFRTMVDAALSSLMVAEDQQALDRDVLYSGYRPLVPFEDSVGIELDVDTLQRLGVVSEDGGIAGGSRQVQCTVLGNGTAVLNLTGERGGDAPR